MGKAVTGSVRNNCLFKAYRSIKRKCKNHALESLEDYDAAKRQQIAKNYIHQYKIKNAVVGFVGPLLLTLVGMIWNKPKEGDLILHISGPIFYNLVLILFFIVLSILFFWYLLQKDVWEDVIGILQDVDSKGLLKQIGVLEETVEVLQNDKNRLEEINSIRAYIDNNVQIRKLDALAERILTQLGAGEFSVGLYHAYGLKYTLDTYKDTRLNADIPSCYKNILNKNNSKYSNYHFFSQLCSNTLNQCCCYKDKDIIKEKLDNAPTEISQYACYNFSKDKKHNMLLEIIAYNDTKFNCDQDQLDDYIANLFKLYIPIFILYTRDDEVKKLLKSC